MAGYVSPLSRSYPCFIIFLLLQLQTSSAIPFSEYILAPSSRTVYPISVYNINGTVSNAPLLTSTTGVSNKNETTTIHGKSAITYDFGKNIGGIVSLTTTNSSSPDAWIGITFSESSMWISGEGSDATADAGQDIPLWFNVGKGTGTYTAEAQYERGGFRYLSLIGNTSAIVEVSSVSINISFAPVMQDLRDYTGYFHSDDELLNRIWYAGAYTNQMCTIAPDHGNSLVHLGSIHSNETITFPETTTWWNNYTISNGTSVSTDGAKRDREVWPGDMAVSMPSVFVSYNDMYSMLNSINSLLRLQESNGRLPYAGVPFSDGNTTSFTYHLYNLIAIANYYQYTGDVTYLQSVWSRFTRGLAWSLSYIDDTGLMNVTASADWLRIGMGGHNIEANAILYYTINQAIILANILNDTTQIPNWTTTASTLKTATNTLLWNETTGLYHDNETTLLSPQDGNTWAIKSSLPLTPTQTQRISSALQSRWTLNGAPAPEAGSPLTISPFISSFELEAHFLSNNSLAALKLMRLAWGKFMLEDARMTNSTFIEGYSADGSLHYAPYTNDARVSHAHGWSTGPTSSLSFYVAGIQLTSANGKTWMMAPQIGDLESVQAGYKSLLGAFSSELLARNGIVVGFNFSTPVGTSGEVRLVGYEGVLVDLNGKVASLEGGVVTGLEGGNWTFVNLIKSGGNGTGAGDVGSWAEKNRGGSWVMSLVVAGVVGIMVW